RSGRQRRTCCDPPRRGLEGDHARRARAGRARRARERGGRTSPLPASARALGHLSGHHLPRTPPDPHRARPCARRNRRRPQRARGEAGDEPGAAGRAWPIAAGAEGPDEDIARELEASAERAALRGGHAAAATALEKAAGLSVDDTLRTSRLLASADAAWLAG